MPSCPFQTQLSCLLPYLLCRCHSWEICSCERLLLWWKKKSFFSLSSLLFQDSNNIKKKNKVSLMRLDTKSPFPVRTTRGRTIFEGKAVHEGHAVEPVLVAGLAHGEQTRAIAQQCALQPAGNVPCAKENANGAIVGNFESERSLTGREMAEEVVSPFTSAFWGSGCSSAFLVKSTGMVAHRHWRWATWGVRVNSARLDRAANHSL